MVKLPTNDVDVDAISVNVVFIVLCPLGSENYRVDKKQNKSKKRKRKKRKKNKSEKKIG